MAFNRHSLMSRLRPLVAEVSTSSEASSLTLNEKVERLREALLAESPEIIRKFWNIFFMRFWLFFWLGPTLRRQNLIFMPRICFFSSRTLRGRKPNPQQRVQLQKLRGSRGGETSWGKGWASEILLNGKHILKLHLLGDLWWRNHQVGNGWTPKISDLLSRLETWFREKLPDQLVPGRALISRKYVVWSSQHWLIPVYLSRNLETSWQVMGSQASLKNKRELEKNSWLVTQPFFMFKCKIIYVYNIFTDNLYQK